MSDVDAPAVAGFRFAGLACGLKESKKPDLALVAADATVPTAAVFTRNLVRAAPVDIAASRVKSGRARAILVNSGNANACTGTEGERAAMETTAAVAEALGCATGDVLPASTGIIGHVLPTEPIRAAVPALVAGLSGDAAPAFADAILTTDNGPKIASATFKLNGARATVLGIAKGAGMIHPDMATTLGFLVTDAPVGKGLLRRLLKASVERTFNRISVDGDTSTNDAIFLMASGKVGGAKLSAQDAGAKKLEKALVEVLDALGTMIVADGEGAQHVVRIEVHGAPSEKAATQVAKTIATSQLVKTALHGRDPNWGRIMGAAGRAGVPFDPAKAEVRIGDVVVFDRGVPVGDPEARAKAAQVMAGPRYTIRVKLRAGKGKASYLTCDLGHEYVRINADYHT